MNNSSLSNRLTLTLTLMVLLTGIHSKLHSPPSEITLREKTSTNKMISPNDSSKNELTINYENFDVSRMLEAITTLFLSGLFDRSFFITTFMAIKYPRWLVMVTASLALCLVGVISVFLGVAINKNIPAIWIDIFSVSLFLFFGVKMVIEAFYMGKEKKDKNCESKLNGDSPYSAEEGLGLISSNQGQMLEVQKECDDISNSVSDKKHSWISVSFKIFLLVFASEVGDRSQISTIFLTNNFDKFIVLIGVVISQNLLTILAIFGGVFISSKVSERNLTFIAGISFLLFAMVAFYVVCMEELFVAKLPASQITSNDIIPGKNKLLPTY